VERLRTELELCQISTYIIFKKNKVYQIADDISSQTSGRRPVIKLALATLLNILIETSATKLKSRGERVPLA
jgi:hypothetical protein